jgi:hypothetical protein
LVWTPLAAIAEDISLQHFVRNGLTSEFEVLAGDLGEALGPKRVGPAASLGLLGFDLSLEVSNTLIDASSSTWQNVGTDVGAMLTTMQLQFRKGLPLSFELGGSVTYMPSGGMWGLGMGLKYALVEGYTYLPDIAVRASVSTALGNRDLNMLMVGSDFVLSKSFGIGGVVSLVPYAGYSLLYVRATTNVVGYFEEGASTPSFNLLPISNVVRHRASLGLDIRVTKVTIGLEAMLSSSIQTLTTRLGVDF